MLLFCFVSVGFCDEGNIEVETSTILTVSCFLQCILMFLHYSMTDYWYIQHDSSGLVFLKV